MQCTSGQLAVCVPTHNGRARAIDDLLTRLRAEPQIDDVEICISDNGSTDGTVEVVARHRASFGDRLSFSRNERNLGMAENVLRAVEMASADYCWLMGSDDAPAPGAIARIRELLVEHAGTSGLALGFLRVDANDLDCPAHAVAPDPFPPQRTVTRFRGRREVAESVGYVTYFTSCNVIHRGRWKAIVDAERPRALRAKSGPHLHVTGRMAAANPDWVWCPQPLVLSREAALYLSDADELGLQDTAVVRRIFADLDSIWAGVYGRYSYAHRALMYKAMRHMWACESLFFQRIHFGGPREMLANLSCARRFWWSRGFWQHQLPVLIMPVASLRDGNRFSRWFATKPIADADRRVSLEGAIPEVMTSGYAVWVTLRVRNSGEVALSSARPYPVTLAARWSDCESGLSTETGGSHVTLWPPLRPGCSRVVEQLVTPPLKPGLYRMSIAAVQADVAWFDAAGPNGALETAVRVVATPS